MGKMSEEVKAALRARAADKRERNPKPGDFPPHAIHMAIDHAKEQGLGLDDDRYHLCVNEDGEWENCRIGVTRELACRLDLQRGRLDQSWQYAARLRWAAGLDAVLAAHLPHARLLLPPIMGRDHKAPRVVRAYRWRTLHAVVGFLAKPAVDRAWDWTLGGRYLKEVTPSEAVAGMVRYAKTLTHQPAIVLLAAIDLCELDRRSGGAHA